MFLSLRDLEFDLPHQHQGPCAGGVALPTTSYSSTNHLNPLELAGHGQATKRMQTISGVRHSFSMPKKQKAGARDDPLPVRKHVNNYKPLPLTHLQTTMRHPGEVRLTGRADTLVQSEANKQRSLERPLTYAQMAGCSRNTKQNQILHNEFHVPMVPQQRQASAQDASATARGNLDNYKSSLLTKVQKLTGQAADIQGSRGANAPDQPNSNFEPKFAGWSLTYAQMAGRDQTNKRVEIANSGHRPSLLPQEQQASAQHTVLLADRPASSPGQTDSYEATRQATDVQGASVAETALQPTACHEPRNPKLPFTYANVLTQPYVPRLRFANLYLEWELRISRPMSAEEWLDRIVLGETGYENLPAETLGKEAPVFLFRNGEVEREDSGGAGE